MLTTTEVAALARVSRFTVEREIGRDHLKAVKTGRIWSIREADAEAWLKSFQKYATQRRPGQAREP